MSPVLRRPRARTSPRAGFSTGDLALGLAVLSLLAALVWPWFRHNAFLDRVQLTVASVDSARAAVEAHLQGEGTLPPGAPPGEIPEALRPHLSAGATFSGDGYALELRRWQALRAPDAPPPPPEEDPEELTAAPASQVPREPPTDSVPTPTPTLEPLVLLSVHARDTILLAALLDHYGSLDSFVRDTVWTLVFPWEGAR